MIKEKQISEIRDLSKVTEKDICIYTFNPELNYKLEQIMENDFDYSAYNYDESGRLSYIILPGGNHYWPSISFLWDENLLLGSMDVEESNMRCDDGQYASETTISNLVIYNYSDKGKLLSHITIDMSYDYGIDCFGTEWNNSPVGDLYEHYCTLENEKKRKYFIYDKNDMLIAYYPAKEYGNYYDSLDTIYSYNMFNQIQANGFENFCYYLHSEVLAKIIEDCYTPIKSEQLLINGKPIKEFLMSIGKSDAQYIILEVADNYFLYYKII
jgi:hypothetical protein